MGRRPDPPGGPQPAPARPASASSTGAWPSSPGSASTSATTRSPTPTTSSALEPDVVIVATGGLPQLRRARGGRRPGGDELGRARRRRHADRRRAVLRRQRHPLGDVGGRDDRPVRRRARDRHARADARHRGRRHEPRAVRAGVQRDATPASRSTSGCSPDPRRSTDGCASRSAATTARTATSRHVDWVVVDHGTAPHRRRSTSSSSRRRRTSARSTTAR